MTCSNTDAHPAHSYESGANTTRWCAGVEKQPHFCGDYTSHKRHENRTHFCPGLTRRQIQAEAIELRTRIRRFGIAIPPRLLVRERQWFLKIADVLESQQHLIADMGSLILDLQDSDPDLAKIVANKGLLTILA